RPSHRRPEPAESVLPAIRVRGDLDTGGAARAAPARAGIPQPAAGDRRVARAARRGRGKPAVRAIRPAPARGTGAAGGAALDRPPSCLLVERESIRRVAATIAQRPPSRRGGSARRSAGDGRPERRAMTQTPITQDVLRDL